MVWERGWGSSAASAALDQPQYSQKAGKEEEEEGRSSGNEKEGEVRGAQSLGGERQQETGAGKGAGLQQGSS